MTCRSSAWRQAVLFVRENGGGGLRVSMSACSRETRRREMEGSEKEGIRRREEGREGGREREINIDRVEDTPEYSIPDSIGVWTCNRDKGVS